MPTNDKYELEDRNLLRTLMWLSLATSVFLAFGIYQARDLVSLLMESR